MERVFMAALSTRTILEINANPRRLDLTDVNARRAAQLGVKIAINCDAHAPDHFDFCTTVWQRHMCLVDAKQCRQHLAAGKIAALHQLVQISAGL